MYPDFEMIVHTIPTNEDIKIFPIYDVHIGSPECREEEFCEFINRVKDEENAYVILGGDLLDNGIKSSVTNCYKAVYSPSEQKRLVANILEPIRHKILCSVSGNHEYRSAKETDDSPVYDIMCRLDLEHIHRENMAFVKITLGAQCTEDGSRTSSKYRPSYVFYVTHGAGGGALSGGVINRNERAGYALDGVDMVLVGHSHKPMMSQPAKIVVDARNNKVSVVPFKVVVASSWLDYGDYAARKMLLPASRCIQTINLSAYHKKLTVTM